MIPKDEYKKLRNKCREKFRGAKLKGLIKPITKKDKCIDCGKPAVCYDHRNYYKPLEVDLVCKSCNNKRGQAYPYCEDWYKSRAGLSEEGFEDLGYSESHLGIDFDFKAYDQHLEYMSYFGNYETDGLFDLTPMKRDGKYVQSEYKTFWDGKQTKFVRK